MNCEESFESEAKYHEALAYLCSRYKGFQSKDLKYVLASICPDFMDGLFERKAYIRNLRYIGETSNNFTMGKSYQSTTFNGATYEITDDTETNVIIGYSHFRVIDDVEPK